MLASRIEGSYHHSRDPSSSNHGDQTVALEDSYKCRNESGKNQVKHRQDIFKKKRNEEMTVPFTMPTVIIGAL